MFENSRLRRAPSVDTHVDVSEVRAREKSLRVRMSEEERAMLDVLSGSMGLSVSDWIRLHVRQAYEELTPAQKRRFKK